MKNKENGAAPHGGKQWVYLLAGAIISQSSHYAPSVHYTQPLHLHSYNMCAINLWDTEYYTHFHTVTTLHPSAGKASEEECSVVQWTGCQGVRIEGGISCQRCLSHTNCFYFSLYIYQVRILTLHWPNKIAVILKWWICTVQGGTVGWFSGKCRAVNKNLVECSFRIFTAFPRTAALSCRPLQSIKGSMNWTIFGLFIWVIFLRTGKMATMCYFLTKFKLYCD